MWLSPLIVAGRCIRAIGLCVSVRRRPARGPLQRAWDCCALIELLFMDRSPEIGLATHAADITPERNSRGQPDLNFIQSFHRMSPIVKILRCSVRHAAEQHSGTRTRAAARKR